MTAHRTEGQCEVHPNLMGHVVEMQTDIKWIKEKLSSKANLIAPGLVTVVFLAVFGYIVVLSSQVSECKAQIAQAQKK